MKINKLLLAALLAVSFTGATSFAQEDDWSEEPAQTMDAEEHDSSAAMEDAEEADTHQEKAKKPVEKKSVAKKSAKIPAAKKPAKKPHKG